MQRLQAAQREQAAKELVSEHQLYASSVQRLLYQEQTGLRSQKMVEPKRGTTKSARNKEAAAAAVQAYAPTITYNILSMMPFSFQGIPMVLVLFESPVPSVKVFEAEDGFFDAEFDFQNNVLDEFRAMDKCLREPSKQTKKQKPSLEPRMKEFMTQPEINFYKRKILRDRGEYKPEVPEYTPVHRAETYQLQGAVGKLAARSRPILSLSTDGPWTQGQDSGTPRRQPWQTVRAGASTDGFGHADPGRTHDARKLGLALFEGEQL